MKRFLRALLIGLALVALAARFYLPVWSEEKLDAALANLDGHTGSVDDVDLALWRGAYRIEGLVIDRDEAGTRKPLL